MNRRNFKVKMGCMIFILLVLCLGQIFSAGCGDVNSSGNIDIVDALLIAQYSVDLNPANFNSAAADVGGNNSIDIVDALLVAQFSVDIISSFPGCNQTPTNPPVPLYINEFMASNSTINQDPDYGAYADWIEIYNAGSQPINLNGYYFTDNLDNPEKWQITQNVTIAAYGYLLIWADDNDTGLHANFKLAQEGEEIGLYTPNLVLVDSVIFDEQTTDMSQGRKTDGSSEWAYFSDPTPGKGNTTTSFSGMVYNVPDFSVTGGLYTSAVTTALSALSGDTIRYTADGSEPSENSTRYSSPITIRSTTVLRARVFRGNLFPGPVVTHTYFINEHVKPGTLPVISLASAPENFWDPVKGIYVQNFKPDWEIPINIELFENNGSDRAAFNQPAGTKVNGLNSWILPQKYLGIYFKKEFSNSDSKLEYPLFFDRSRTHFKSFGLRSSGSDWSYTMFRDALAQNCTRPYMDTDMQGYRPSVVYINGQYMGIHNMRSKVNDDFIEQNYGMEGGSYDLIENGTTVDEGSLDAYNQLKTLLSQSLSVQANYDAVAAKMDIPEFTDFIIAEIYVRNTSFQHNIVTWKPKDSGKWRWILTDLDRGFFLAKDDPLGASYIDKISSFAMDSSTPLGKLLNNAGYKAYFARRMADHLYTTFHPARMKKIIDTFKQGIEQEIPYHIQKWQGTTSSYGNAIPSVDYWNNQINYIKSFTDVRTQALLTDLTSYGLSAPSNLAITVSPANGGIVNINGLAVPEADWSGAYPKNLQLQLSAVTKPGYTFRGWAYKSNPNTIISTNAAYSFTLTDDSSYVALFQPTGQTLLPATITGNMTLTKTSSPYFAQGDITINNNCTVTIQAGVEIWMPKGANIFINGNINATGTSAQPVIFKLNPSFAGAGWGALCFTNTTATSNFTYVTVEDASHGPIPIKDVAAISGWHTNLVLDHMTIENVFCNPVALRYSDIVLTNSSLHIKEGFVGDEINVKYGNARIENCTFRGDITSLDTDAIDYDNVPNGIIRNCIVYNFLGENNDAMDIGGKDTNCTIDNVFVYNIFDKGLSVGQKATVKVTNSTFVDCNMGMGLKDISNTTADHCTFYGNNISIACYEKALGRLGGNAVVTNCILSNSTEASYSADDKSTLDITYSISDNDLLPSNWSNLFGNPIFMDPTRYDFRLHPASPCIGTGNNGDMGTLLHNYTGEPSLMFTAIYYNPLNDDSKSEFLTLYNPGQQPLDISGYKISEGIKFTFPEGTILGAGESFILSKSSGITLIGARPGNSAKWESGSLANEGEPLKLENKYGMVVDYVDYLVQNPWPVMVNTGDVLTIKANNLDNHLPDSWSVSAYDHMVMTN